MQFPIDNILIVPSKNDFMNEIGAFVTVYTQIPRSNLNSSLIPNTSQHLSPVYVLILINISHVVSHGSACPACFSDCPTSWCKWLQWWKSHLYRYRKHIASFLCIFALMTKDANQQRQVVEFHVLTMCISALLSLWFFHLNGSVVVLTDCGILLIDSI